MKKPILLSLLLFGLLLNAEANDCIYNNLRPIHNRSAIRLQFSEDGKRVSIIRSRLQRQPQVLIDNTPQLIPPPTQTVPEHILNNVQVEQPSPPSIDNIAISQPIYHIPPAEQHIIHQKYIPRIHSINTFLQIILDTGAFISEMVSDPCSPHKN